MPWSGDDAPPPSSHCPPLIPLPPSLASPSFSGHPSSTPATPFHPLAGLGSHKFCGIWQFFLSHGQHGGLSSRNGRIAIAGFTTLGTCFFGLCPLFFFSGSWPVPCFRLIGYRFWCQRWGLAPIFVWRTGMRSERGFGSSMKSRLRAGSWGE